MSRRKKRVLVADDEPGIRRLLATVLAERGCWVDVAGTFDEAFNRLGARYDLYVFDQHLPGGNGLRLAEQVRRIHRTAAIAMITGHSSQESALLAMDQRVDAYLDKPFRDVYAVAEILVQLTTRNDHPSSPDLVPRRGESERANSASSDRSARGGAGRDGVEGPLLAWWVGARGDWVELGGHWPDDGQTLLHHPSVSAALSGLRVSPPDLVVVDLALQGGQSLLKALRRTRPGARLVVMGDRPDLRTLQVLIDLGVETVVERSEGIPSIAAQLRRMWTELRFRSGRPSPAQDGGGVSRRLDELSSTVTNP